MSDLLATDNPTIIPATSEAVAAYDRQAGGWNGAYILILTDEMVQAIKEGQAIAAGIAGNEYGIVITRVSL